MQAIAETLFDAVYLLSVITLGIIMIVKSEKNKEYPLFGARYSVLPISALSFPKNDVMIYHLQN